MVTIIVYYRLCNIPSTNPSPIYQDDKMRLNKLCLRSFVLAFKDIKPKMHFIADYCGEEYRDIIKEIVPFEHTIEFTSLGINGTALRQYELAKENTDNIILFQECDYVWRPSVGVHMVEAIEKLELVSPYDHPDFYTRPEIHDQKPKVILFKDNHYRTATRNTMTFGMKRGSFMANYEILKRYGYLDNEVWKDMCENGTPLYTPIPSFATHMVKDFMAPSIPWPVIFDIFS